LDELRRDLEKREALLVCLGVLKRFFCWAEKSSLERSAVLAWEKMLDLTGVIMGDWMRDLFCLEKAWEVAIWADQTMLCSWSLQSLVRPE